MEAVRTEVDAAFPFPLPAADVFRCCAGGGALMTIGAGAESTATCTWDEPKTKVSARKLYIKKTSFALCDVPVSWAARCGAGPDCTAPSSHLAYGQVYIYIYIYIYECVPFHFFFFFLLLLLFFPYPIANPYFIWSLPVSILASCAVARAASSRSLIRSMASATRHFSS